LIRVNSFKIFVREGDWRHGALSADKVDWVHASYVALLGRMCGSASGYGVNYPLRRTTSFPFS